MAIVMMLGAALSKSILSSSSEIKFVIVNIFFPCNVDPEEV